MTKHEDTIGQITHEGVDYEIDWPYDLEHEHETPTQRADFAVIYRDGEMVGEFVNPDWGRFDDEEHVMDLAQQFIEMGGVDQ